MSAIEYHPLQQEAIDAACDISNRVVAVTGPAGSGKTTVLKTVYDSLVAAGYVVVLCSPTGKAAKRIFEVTGIEAMTIHRLLKFNHPGDPDPKTGKAMGVSMPRYCRSLPIGADGDSVQPDVVLVDEYAMVNVSLHDDLMAALPNGCSIRMFGDNNQLAPIEEDKRLVGQPSPFLKILTNPKLKSVTLDTVFRQGADSGILLNATGLLRSRIPTKNEQWGQKITDQPVKELIDYVLESEENGVSFAKIENQIIVPQNKSWVGTIKLNSTIQGLFHNHTDPSLKIPRKDWVVGENEKTGKEGGYVRMYVRDKVIFCANNYDLGIFNGETGVVIEIDNDTGEIVVDFGDREQSIPPVLMVQNRYGTLSQIDPRKDLDLAYAITTHKSQGSEYKHVVYILNKSNLYMINRRNTYTAVTRAREHVYLIADQKGLSNGVYRKEGN